MKKLKKINAKCNNFINKYKKHSPTTPKSSESFKWKDVNWKKIELRLNILQNKIYAARKNLNIWKVRKLQRLILNSYDFKKLAVRKVTQLINAVCHDRKIENRSFRNCVRRNSLTSIS